MKLSEQVNTVERALGERMITHGMVIVRQWANELGNELYTNRIDQLEQNYRYVFDYFLSTDDPDRDALLDKMTGEAYRLTDEVYAALRLQRGLSPEMYGFNPRNPQSVMHYFSSCVQLQPGDLQWLQQAAQYENSATIAIAASAALAQNLRERFNETAMLALIDVANSDNGLVADQALANLILLLAHYDVRIDFFPNIQDAFMAPLGDGTHAFETLCALIRSTKISLRDVLASGQLTFDDLPNALKDLLGSTGDTPDIESIESWMPASENEYMAGITAILPETWVYAVIIGDNPEREEKVALTYLTVGKMDLMWDNLDLAEGWLTQRLCSEQAMPIDYINYGHCCFLRGDRMMAYENYREARSRCKTSKEFFALFRPDRHFLVERGIPVEQIYLMEDQLLRSN